MRLSSSHSCGSLYLTFRPNQRTDPMDPETSNFLEPMTMFSGSCLEQVTSAFVSIFVLPSWASKPREDAASINSVIIALRSLALEASSTTSSAKQRLEQRHSAPMLISNPSLRSSHLPRTSLKVSSKTELNKSVESGSPCLTPLASTNGLLICERTATFPDCVAYSRLKISMYALDTPCLSSAFQIAICSTLSKAFWKSRKQVHNSMFHSDVFSWICANA